MGKKIKIIGLSAAVLAIAAAVLFLGKNFIKSPEVKVGLGFAAFASELSDCRAAFDEKIGFDAIKEKTGTLRTKTDLSVNIPELNNAGMNLGIDALTNKSEKRADYSFSAGMYGFKIDIGEVICTPDALYIKSPGFVKDAYMLSVANIGREFNASEWASIAGKRLPDDFSLEFFNAEDEDEPFKEASAILAKPAKFILENAAFENIKEKKDGFSGVRVTVSRDDAAECIEEFKNGIFESVYYGMFENIAGAAAYDTEYEKYFKGIADDALSVSFKTDVKMDFYFDKKGRIVNIATPSDIETESGIMIAVDIKFTGEERALDIIEGNISLKENEMLYSVSYANKLDMEEMSYDTGLEIEADGSLASLKADGGFEDIVKGESCTFRVNNLSLALDEKEIFYARAAVDIESSDKLPEIPDNYVNLLDMDKMKILAMFYEISDSIGKLGL